MAKDRKAAEDLRGPVEQTMEQARTAVDIYFDSLKKAISSMPSGGTEFGEKLKSCAEENLTTAHDFVRQLSQVKDFNDVVRIQTEFMQSLVSAMGDQTKELADACTKTAAGLTKNPFVGMS